MTILRISDNTRQDESRFAKIPNLTNLLKNKSLKYLQSENIFVYPNSIKDSEDLSEEQIILQSIDGKIKTSNLMGFLQIGDEKLIIDSRFSNAKSDYFQQYLLEQVLRIPNLFNLEVNLFESGQIDNLFIFVFPFYLKKALRKGLFKTYLKNEYNDTHIKGVIDVKKQIIQNTPFMGNVAYSQREFSFDNRLTELIRHTIEYIEHNNFGKLILGGVRHETKIVRNFTPGYSIYNRKIVIRENVNNPITHAYFREYKILQQICLSILRQRGGSVLKGTSKINGILFDGAWLWEEYLNIVIQNDFYHPRNKLKENVQWLFKSNRSNVGAIYPDFIGKNYSKRIIADAKYKPIQNINERDYQQVLAYMYRFSSRRGFYLYPTSENEIETKLNMNSGTSFENNLTDSDVFLFKLGLKIPDNAETYENFKKQMGLNEYKFIFRFRTLIEDFLQ